MSSVPDEFHKRSALDEFHKRTEGLRSALQHLAEDGKSDLSQAEEASSYSKGISTASPAVTVDERRKGGELKDQLDILCLELDDVSSKLDEHRRFEHEFFQALVVLEANVGDIREDLLPPDKHGKLTEADRVNFRTLRDNINRVKMLIPSRQQTANFPLFQNIGSGRATREIADLPNLYNSDIFKGSYYFKEIQDKYLRLDDRHKLCLLCFAIFPEEAEISKSLLRLWWVGENLIPEGKEEMRNEILRKFVDEGFIEPVGRKDQWSPKSYMMNPIVRSCVITFAQEAGFFDYDDKGNPTMNFSWCKKAGWVRFKGHVSDKGSGNEALPVRLRKLQMFLHLPDQQTFKNVYDRFRDLQTLFNVNKNFLALPPEWIPMMTGLTVLYLGRWERKRSLQIMLENTEFLEGLKHLKILRLLSLQGIHGIQRLPESVCKLTNLRILDLRACSQLEKLPDNIGSLKMLTYLDVSECHLLDGMPKRVTELSKLQVLKGFVITDRDRSCTLIDLGKLTNLKKLSVFVTTGREFDIDDAGRQIYNLQKLEKLKIAWRSRNEGALPLSGEGNSVPNQNKGLPKLVKLDVQSIPYGMLPQWLVPTNFCQLKNLYVRGGRLCQLPKGECTVEILRLQFLTDLKINWKDLQVRFPNLKYFELHRCPRVSCSPSNKRGVWLNS